MRMSVPRCVYLELELHDEIVRRQAAGIRHAALTATLAQVTQRLAYVQGVLRERRGSA